MSTDEQAREGVSLSVQRNAAEAVLQAKGCAPIEIVEDGGQSGADLRRPGIRDVLTRLDRGQLSGICVWKLDRLTRSLRDLLDIVERMQPHGTELLSIQESIDTSGPIGRFTLSLMGALAQLEREQISERVRAARNHLQANGYYTGGPIPHGCRTVAHDEGRILQPDPETAPYIAPLWQMVIDGASLADLVDYLRLSPAKHRGRGWSKMAVSNLLKREALVGVLVDRDTWDRAQQTLATRSHPGRQDGARSSTSDRIWPLRGIALCGQCGATLVGVRGGKRLPYLRCSGRIRHGRQHCDAKDLPATTVERSVAEGLRHLLAEDNGLLEQLADELATPTDEADQHLLDLTRERDRLAAHRDRILDLLQTGDTQATKAITARLSELQTALDVAQERLDQSAAAAAATDAQRHSHAAQFAALRDLIADLPNLPPQDQANTLAALIESVTLTQESLDYVLTPGLRPKNRCPPGEDGQRFVESSRMLPKLDEIRTKRKVEVLIGVGSNRRMVIAVGGNVARIKGYRGLPLKTIQDNLKCSQSTASRIRRGVISDAALCDLIAQS